MRTCISSSSPRSETPYGTSIRASVLPRYVPPAATDAPAGVDVTFNRQIARLVQPQHGGDAQELSARVLRSSVGSPTRSTLPPSALESGMMSTGQDRTSLVVSPPAVPST